MKSSEKKFNGLNRQVRHGVAALLAGLPVLAIAGPQDGQIIRGAADILHPDAQSTHIRQHTDNVLIDWQDFSIENNETVVFEQPDTSSLAVNRVIGDTASNIFGQLQANGQIFILNPRGVFFAPGAQLDVQGLVAGAGTMSIADFDAGNLRISNSGATVRNEGSLTSAPGGFVVLTGERVENSGTIRTDHGDTALLSGRSVTINIAGNEMVSYAIDDAAAGATAGIDNAGEIFADGGMIVMDAYSAGNLASAAINQRGRVQANSYAVDNGRVILKARGGDIAVSGELDADGVNGADGGRMLVHSDRNITVTQDARLHADGRNGGTVRAIAEKGLDLQTGSELSTQNLAATGKGGFIEASGHETFNLEGDIRTGDGGTFLIDPTDVTIVAGTASSGTAIGTDYIEGLLNGGTNVLVVASNSISVNETIVALGGAGDLTLTIGTVASGCATDPVCSGASSINLVGDGTITVSAGAPIKINGTLMMNAQDGTITLEDDIESWAEFIRLDAGPLAVGAQYDGVINTGTATQSDISVSADDHIILLAGDLVKLGQLSSASSGNIVITVNGNTRANSGILDLAATPGGNAAYTTGQLTINLDGGNDSAIMNIDGNLRGGANVDIAQDGGSASAIATISGFIESVNGQAIAALNGGAGGGHFTVNGVNGSGESMRAKNSVGVAVTGDPNAVTSAATINLAGGMRTDTIGGIAAATLRAEHTAGNATGGSGATINVGGDVFGRSFGMVETKVGSLTGGDISIGGDYASTGNVNVIINPAAGGVTASPTASVGAISSTGGNFTATINRGSLEITSSSPGTVAAIDAAKSISLDVFHGDITVTGDIIQSDVTTGGLVMKAGNTFDTGIGNITVNGDVSTVKGLFIESTAGGTGGNIALNGALTSVGNSRIISKNGAGTGGDISIGIAGTTPTAISHSGGAMFEVDATGSANGSLVVHGDITTDSMTYLKAATPLTVNGNVTAIDELTLRSMSGDITAGDLSLASTTGDATLYVDAQGSGSSSVGNVTVSSTAATVRAVFTGDTISSSSVNLNAAGDVRTSATGAPGVAHNVSGDYSATAVGAVVLQGGHVVNGKMILTGNTVEADDSILDSPLTAGFLAVEAAISAIFDSLVQIGTGTDATRTGDSGLDTALTTNGLAALGHTANAVIKAPSVQFQDVVLDGDYVHITSNSVGINGTVTANSAMPYLQLVPLNSSDSFGLESATAGSMDANFTWSGQLEKLAGNGLILGSTTHAGDALLGSSGSFDMGSTNLLVLTNGSITGFDQLTSTGVIGALDGRKNSPPAPAPVAGPAPAPVAGPAPAPAPVAGPAPAPVAGPAPAPAPAPVPGNVFEIPLPEETEEDEEEGGGTTTGGQEPDEDSQDGSGIQHRTAAETLQCQI